MATWINVYGLKIEGVLNGVGFYEEYDNQHGIVITPVNKSEDLFIPMGKEEVRKFGEHLYSTITVNIKSAEFKIE